jgi:RNA polymerase sigma-70 factor (ECF subfamily)
MPEEQMTALLQETQEDLFSIAHTMVGGDILEFSSHAAPIRTEAEIADFERLFRAQKTRLSSFVRKHLRNTDAVQDIVQHTFLEAYRCWHKFRGESRPETWLCGIALNLVRNSISRSPEYRYIFEDADEMGDLICTEVADDPLEIALREESLKQIRYAITTLPASMRTVVSMVVLEGLSYQETAEELDIPIGTVRSRLSRAREQLKAFCL